MALTRGSSLLVVALASLSACTAPLKLAKDDSAVVLAHQSLTAPNPGERGSYAVKFLTYGSGTDKQRPEYGAQVTIKTKTVVPCQPCHRPICTMNDHRCMRDIPASDVVAEAERVLAIS